MAGYATHASADNFRLARSRVIATPSDGTYDCILIPRYAFLRDVRVLVSTAGSSDDVTLGWIGNGASADADYFFNGDDLAVTTEGMKRAFLKNTAGDIFNTPFPGLWCQDAAGMIYITVGTTQSTGAFVVFAEYTVLH